jgi:hypothetical protein
MRAGLSKCSLVSQKYAKTHLFLYASVSSIFLCGYIQTLLKREGEGGGMWVMKWTECIMYGKGDRWIKEKRGKERSRRDFDLTKLVVRSASDFNEKQKFTYSGLG